MRFLEKVIFWFRYRFYRYTALSKKQIFISAIDLMQPQNGVVNAVQLVVVSRMLDFELIQSGQSSYWASRLNEHRLGINEALIEDSNVQYSDILASFDKYGWDYNLSSISANISPFSIYNGTHRCGLSLLKNPFQVVPVTLDYDGWDWTKQEGISRLQRNGIADEDIDILTTRHKQLLDENRVDYILIVMKSVYDSNSQEIIDAINNLGKVSVNNTISWSRKNTPSWMTSKNKAFFNRLDDNDQLQIIRFSCFNKDITIRNGEMVSITIEDFLKGLSIKEYAYTATITQSIELGFWLKQLG